MVTNDITRDEFYICGSVHRNSRLKKSKKMEQYADIYLLLNYSIYVSGVHRAHHQECSCSLWYRSYYMGSKLPQT